MGLISGVSSRTYRNNPNMLVSKLRLGHGPAKRMLTKRTGRHPITMTIEGCVEASPFKLGANPYAIWAGMLAYVTTGYAVVPCVHRFNHFKKYGGGFKK